MRHRYDLSKIAAVTITLTALIILSATPASAEDSYEIYTYGSGDFVAQVLTGVALLFSGNYIQSLVKVILLIGLLTVLLSPVSAWLSRGTPIVPTGSEGFLAIIRQTLIAVIAVYIFIIPKTNVAIIDRLDPSQSQVVGNVPFVQGIIAHGASVIGDVLGREMESAFSLPDELKFRESGMGLGIKHINSIYDIMPPSPSTFSISGASSAVLISASLKDYFNQCVFKNFSVLDGYNGPKSKALYGLMTTVDALSFLEGCDLFTDPNISVIAPNESGTATCAEVIPLIKTAWQSSKNAWYSQIEKNTKSGTVETVMSHYFPDGGDPFVMLQNIAVGNIMKSAARNYQAATTGDYTELGEELALTRTVGGWQTAAKMFEKIVHVMRNVFEGLIYGLSVLLPVAIAVAGLSPLGTYLKIVLWLQLWVPFYVLLNLYGDMELARSLDKLVQISGGNFISIAEWKEVGEKTQVALGYLGSFAFTVPTFAWGLIKGGEYAMSSAMHAVSSGGGADRQASLYGGGAAVGEVSLDNQSIGNMRWRSGTRVGQQVSFEMGAGQNTGNIESLGAGMTNFARETTKFNNQETIGTMSGRKELAWNYAGGSVTEAARLNAIQSGAAPLANVTGLEKAGMTPIQGANANAKESVARTVANESRTQGDHNMVAKVGIDQNVGNAKGVSGYARSVGTDAENLTKKLTTFSKRAENARVDAINNVAKARGVSSDKLLHQMNSAVTLADGSGVHSVGVSGGKVVSDQVTSGHGTTHYDNSQRTVTGKDFDFGQTQMTAAIMNGDVKGYLDSVGGGKNMWHDKNTGMAAAMHTADAIGQYVDYRQGENSSVSISHGAITEGKAQTPLNKVLPVSASASIYGEINHKSSGTSSRSRNEIRAGLMAEYENLYNDKSLTDSQRTGRFMLKAQSYIVSANSMAEKSEISRTW